MSWDELRARLSQEFGKRIEYTAYRMGVASEPRVDIRTTTRSPRFFFAPELVASRVDLLRKYLPEAIPATIEEADEILQHRFRLLGYRDLDYGAEIDWHLDAVHRKRAPETAWYKIHFLDFEEVGDHKVTWELNRHQHLVVLAKAYTYTGQREYLDEIEREFYSWQKSNPYPIGINWGSSLEVAFRSLSWIWVQQLLRGSISENLDRDLVRGLARNGHYIERYLSTYFSPNTHLIGEALALLSIGTLCPEIAASKRWQTLALNVLIGEIQRQVRPDGVYFEQSLYYHVYALDMFLYGRALASVNDLQLPASYDSVLQKMLHLVETLCRNGPPQGFGDDDGGRLFDPRRNRADHMADPLAIGACMFNELDLPSAKLTEESVWLFGDKAVTRLEGNQNKSRLNSCAFQDGGLYVISSGGAHGIQMLVDAGPHGIGHGGHGHADALSLRLSIDGRPWLIDPGAYIYISPGEERNQFRGTAAHNTVRVDGVDQAVPETPFSWSSLPEVTSERWETGNLFTFFSASHTGYQRLSDPVLHRRAVFHLHDEYWLVRDVLVGQREHDLEIYWHFASDLELSAQGGVLVAKAQNRQLAILGAGEGGHWVSLSGKGYFSPAYGYKEIAPIGVFRRRQNLPAEHASLLLPVSASAQTGEFRMSACDSHVATYRYERGAVEDEIVFAKAKDGWSYGSCASDADFFFLRRESHEIVMLGFCGASYLEIRGQRVFSAPAKVRWLEWSSTAGLASSDSQSRKFFHGELIRTRTPVR